jgi:hypothetical protein
MVTEIEKASRRLYGPGSLGVMNIKFFPPVPGMGITAEQLAAQINRALDQIEAGDFEEITDRMGD